jgi:hypothetical protein
MVGSGFIIVFVIFYFSVLLFYSNIPYCRNNSNSWIYVGKDSKSWTGIGIPTHTRVCLEVNTHTGILDYFINDKHIKDRVVNIPKDVYFGV